MKKSFAGVVLLVVVNLIAAPSTSSTRSASLYVPAEIVFAGAAAVCDAEVEVRWDEDDPLLIQTWSQFGGLSTAGDLAFFDEGDREVAVLYPASISFVPDGQKEVRKGESLRLKLYWLGAPQFPRSGRYYAIATFSWAWTSGKNVTFRTERRWINVIKKEESEA